MINSSDFLFEVDYSLLRGTLITTGRDRLLEVEGEVVSMEPTANRSGLNGQMTVKELIWPMDLVTGV